MKVLVTGLIVLGLFAVSTLWRAATIMCQEEIRTRLGQLPRALIWLAARRLPKEVRSDLAAEWTAELEFMVAKTEGLPVTRFWRGLTYAGGLLRVAPCVAQEMASAPEKQMPMVMRLVTLAICVYATAGELSYAVHYLGGANPVRGVSPSLVALAGVALGLAMIFNGPLGWPTIGLFMLSCTACGIGMILLGGWPVLAGVVVLMGAVAVFILRLRYKRPVLGNEPQSMHSDA